LPHSTATTTTTKALNKQQEDEHSEITKTQSMFNDIKQVLKAVEESKSKIDTRLSELNRQRENKLFYNKTIFNNDNGELLLGVDEQRRTRKLVDGCISAITTDVQRIVEQKLIDESRHVKLVAEKDTNTTTMNTKAKRVSFPLRTRSVDKPSTTTTATTTSQTKKYLNQIYGPTFLAQLKKEEQEKKQKELREQQQQQQAAENLKRQQKNLANNNRTKKNAVPKQTKQKPPSPPPQKLSSSSSSNSATAFFTIPFKSFSPRSRSTSHEKSKTPPRQPKNVITNVGLVNIITSDSHLPLSINEEPLKELKRQVRQTHKIYFFFNGST
jgi:hypothetical protein